jgi:hypothetical protein
MKLKEIDKKIEKLTEILDASTMINQQKDFKELNKKDIKLNELLIQHKRKISEISNKRHRRVFSITKLRTPNISTKNTKYININKTSNKDLKYISDSSKHVEEVKTKGILKKTSNNSNLAYFRKLQTRIEEIYTQENLPEIEDDNDINNKNKSFELKSYVSCGTPNSSEDSPLSKRKKNILKINEEKLNNDESFTIEPINLNIPYINNEIKEENEESNSSQVINI